MSAEAGIIKTFLAVTILVAAAFVSGCATRTVYHEVPVVAAPAALTLAQIKEMTAKGVSDDTILNALRASRAVYRLTSQDVLDLQQAKVSQAVIDYLLTTPQLYPSRPAPVRRYYYYYPAYPYYPYWYPDWHWGWHFDFGHHDFHHGHH